MGLAFLQDSSECYEFCGDSGYPWLCFFFFCCDLYFSEVVDRKSVVENVYIFRGTCFRKCIEGPSQGIK